MGRRQHAQRQRSLEAWFRGLLASPTTGDEERSFCYASLHGLLRHQGRHDEADVLLNDALQRYPDWVVMQVQHAAVQWGSEVDLSAALGRIVPRRRIDADETLKFVTWAEGQGVSGKGLGEALSALRQRAQVVPEPSAAERALTLTLQDGTVLQMDPAMVYVRS